MAENSTYMRRFTMLKKILSVMFVFAFASLAFAQDEYHKIEVSGGYSFARNDGFPGDAFVGTSSFGTGVTSNPNSRKRKNMNGFEASAVYNFSRYFGAKFGLSGLYGKDPITFIPGGTYQRVNPPTILVIPGTQYESRLTQYNYMGGVQFKDNSKETKIKPFGHFLVGVARQTTKFKNIDQQRINLIGGTDRIKNNGFAYTVGGGLDLRVSKRVDIRVIQFDYNRVNIKAKTLVANGAVIDAGVPGFNQVTTLQSVGIAKRHQNNFRLGFGIVFH